MNFLLLFVKSFLIVIGISLIFTNFFNIKIGEAIPISFIIISLVIFICGLAINNLFVGNIALYVLAFIGFIIYLYCIFIRKQKVNITSGFIAFIVIYIIFFIYCYQYKFSMWDEFSHWGPMVRTMVNNNSFYINFPKIGGAHIEYPPLLSSIEYFFCILYGNYSEAVCSLALHIFEFSIIIPYIFDSFENKKILSKILFSFMLLFIVLTLDVYTLFRTIYVDVAIPLISIYSFLLIIDHNNPLSIYKTTALSLSLVATLLSKEVGIAFFLCSIFYFLYVNVIENKNLNKKNIYKAICIILVPFIFWLLWYMYCKTRIDTSATQFSISTLLSNISLGNLSVFQKDVINKIFVYLANETIIKSGIVRLSYFAYLIVFISIIVCIMVMTNEYSKNIGYLLLFIISNVGYILLLIVLYCYCFSQGEATNLNSFERYLFAMNVYCILSFIIYIYKYLELKNFYLILVLILLISKDTLFVCPPAIFTKQDVVSDEEVNVSQLVNDYISEDSLIHVCTNDFLKTTKLKYLTDNKCSLSWSDINKDVIDIEKLKQYNYIMFSYTDNTFEKINDIFDQYTNTDGIYNDVLYKVEFINDVLKLTMVC